MSTYETTWADEALEEHLAPAGGRLGNAVLIQNARWFTQVRWIVVAVLVLSGAACSLLRAPITEFGFVVPTRWPWMLAGILALVNVLFCVLTRRLRSDAKRSTVKANIWMQIVGDLLIVTALVHLVGSVDTFFSFTYLFHIALACIFFPPSESLLVTLSAACLYLGCVGLETAGLLSAGGVLATPLALPQRPPHISLILAGSAVGVWLVVWYLASTLSEAVRRRDQELHDANERLLRADQEKNKQVLRVTHDLKAPFSGIQSNIQVLRFKYWEEMTEPVRGIIERIQVRSQTLSERIRDILLLGDLRARDKPAAPGTADLRAVIETTLEDLRDTAATRRVTLAVDVPVLRVVGEAKCLSILFANLITNAILYSQEGGNVEIQATVTDRDVRVDVRDHGIGISAEALPRIFDEFFRTKEAVRFNKRSTGLGLPIVKTIARNLGLRIRVDSEEGKGTLFEVFLRSAEQAG